MSDFLGKRDEFVGDFIALATEKGWLIGGSNPKSRADFTELCETYAAGYALALEQAKAAE